MLPVFIALALATPSATDVELWLAKAKDAQKRGNAHERAGNHAAAKPELCEAFFYYSKILERQESQEALRGAFNSAYYSDLAKSAATLYPKITAPTEAEQGRKADLDMRTADSLVDDACPAHVAACGDAILDTGETCDDGNKLAGDGCADTCALEQLPTTAPARQETASAPPTETLTPKPVDTSSAASETPPTAVDSRSAVPYAAGAVGAVGVLVSVGALIVGVYQNGQINAEDTSDASRFLLEPQQRKGAEDTRNAAYAVSAIAGVVGIGGIAAAAFTWE